MKVIVSDHAIDRLKERFGLKFYRYTSSREMMRNLIIGQVSTGTHLIDWKNTPFYVNKMASKYGPDTEIYFKSGVYFVCKAKGDTVFVRTCMDRVLYYKKAS